MKRFILWGSRGHAKVLATAISRLSGQVIAVFDNDESAQPVLPGVPLFIGQGGFDEWSQDVADLESVNALVAIGGARGIDRTAIQSILEARGLRVEALIHPEASVDSTAMIGPGSQLLALSLVAADVRVGRGCILNHRASADHESILGDGVHLAPGATLCGCVTLEDYVMIGAGAVVLPRIRIGANTVVGAGAVVTRDLPAGVIAVGNPARIRRPNELAT